MRLAWTPSGVRLEHNCGVQPLPVHAAKTVMVRFQATLARAIDLNRPRITKCESKRPIAITPN